MRGGEGKSQRTRFVTHQHLVGLVLRLRGGEKLKNETLVTHQHLVALSPDFSVRENFCSRLVASSHIIVLKTECASECVR